MVQFLLPIADLERFMLVLFRMSAFFISSPFFNSRNIPTMVKAGLSMGFAWILLPMVADAFPVVPSMNVFSFFTAVLGELIIGLAIGFTLQVLLAGIQLAGSFIDVQVGFAMSRVIDPVSDTENTTISQFLYISSVLIFLSINGHYYVITAIVDSFKMVPPLTVEAWGKPMLDQTLVLGWHLFNIGMRVAMPVLTVLITVNVVFGIFSRLVPQMHVFIVAMPVKIMVGMIFLGIIISFMPGVLRSLLIKLKELFFAFLNVI